MPSLRRHQQTPLIFPTLHGPGGPLTRLRCRPQSGCRVMSNLGEAYSFRAHRDRAVDLVKAEQVFSKLASVETREVNPAGWAQTLSCLAAVRWKMSDVEGTARYLGQAGEGYRLAGIARLPQVYYQLLAIVHERKGELGEQVSVLRELLATNSREIFPGQWARAAVRLAQALSASDPAEASQLLEEALKALDSEPAATRLHAVARWLLAQQHLRKGSRRDRSRAIELLEGAREALRGDLPERDMRNAGRRLRKSWGLVHGGARTGRGDRGT
jgi:hypothetical protein